MKVRLAPDQRRKETEMTRSSNHGHLSAEHKLLTDSWTADVGALETSIAESAADGPPAEDCRVVFFEIAGDAHLHVNVTHRHQTTAVNGWAGPGNVAAGFVYNRIFRDTPPKQILRRIREMVFADRMAT